jgi:peptide/nickel transport system substrate-binding protein
MHRFRTLLALAGLLALLLVACDAGEDVDIDGEDIDDAEPGDAADDDAADDDAGDAEPATGGTLVVAMSAEPDQLDPHVTTAYASFQVLENVYDTLVQPDDNLEMEGALAESWEVSDDQLVWTFNLREGVTWHDGSDFTADDVVYSYNRIIEGGLSNAWRFGAVTEVRAVDEATVEIEVNAPSPNLLAAIGAFKGMAIVQDGAFGAVGEEPDEDAGPSAVEPVGTGPFVFGSYSEGSGITLEANPDYWGGDVAVEGVEFRFIPEGSVRITALQTGEVDVIDTVPPQDVDTIMGSDDVESDAVASADYYYFALNMDREPFDDPDVRRALAFGFDRNAVAEAAAFGNATVNQTAIPEASVWHHDYAPYSFDADQARQLLEDAGVEDLTIDLMVSGDHEETIQAAQVLEAQWSDIGVSVDIRVEDFATWLDDQGNGEFDAFMLSWIGNIDPDDFYYAQHHSEGGLNFQGYANPEVDELLDAARTETDENARKALYDDATELIVDEASYVYLYNPDTIQAWSPDVSGYVVRPDAALRLEGVSLSR